MSDEDGIGKELREEIEEIVRRGDIPGEQMMRACLMIEDLQRENERLLMDRARCHAQRAVLTRALAFFGRQPVGPARGEGDEPD